jgi:predicted restriction endonuclease
MNYWNNCCAVTSIDVPQLLKASHAKPWKDCETDSDRLNVYNGFLLSANLDSLFDAGLISFDDSGETIFSSRLSETQIATIGIRNGTALRWIDPRHIPFLRWHREKIFKK